MKQERGPAVPAAPVAIQEARAEPQPPAADAHTPAAEEPPFWITTTQLRAAIPARAWRSMDDLDLEAELCRPARTVREPPRWFRAQLRKAYSVALTEWQQRGRPAAWKLFILIPRMLLQPTEQQGDAGTVIFRERIDSFLKGDWVALLDAVSAPQCAVRAIDGEAAERNRLKQVEAKIRLKEISRARVHLTSSGVAPGTEETLQELTDPELRPNRPTEEIPSWCHRHVPATAFTLKQDELLAALRSAGRGSAQDLSGTRYEHLRVLIEDEALWGVFAAFAQAFARAQVPDDVMQALRLGRMTALKKEGGRIRGIVAGSVLRRLVGKAVARQYAARFLHATAPYQFALRTPAGTDVVAHILRYITEGDPDKVVVSLDGIGAFDHVRRAAFVRKIASTPELESILPLVLALYGSESRFFWYDDEGQRHVIHQAEGGEQGGR